MSIESQVNEMLQLAEQQGLHVADIRREAHSAKNSGQREVLNTLLADLAADTFDAILTWAPDRLSRNAGDLGSIVDLMDQGHIKEIRTHGQTFSNSPNEKFLLMILGSQAKLENDHRGLNVKRGLRAKAGSGWRPGMPPLGYNIMKAIGPNDKKIVIDQERAETIQLIFKKVGLYGFSGRMIHRWLKEETSFTTRSGNMLALSAIFRMMKNPFYYGMFEFPEGSGNWYVGKHDPLITKDVFDAANEQMQRPDTETTVWGAKNFHFTQLLTCGTCGSGVTAEEKFKKLLDGSKRRYVYYHCTRGRDVNCAEKFIREEELLKQLLHIIDQVDLNTIAAKRKFQEELERFRKFARGVLGQVTDGSTGQKVVDMKMYVRYVLQEGTREEKQEILKCLDGKLLLKDQKIQIDG